MTVSVTLNKLASSVFKQLEAMCRRKYLKIPVNISSEQEFHKEITKILTKLSNARYGCYLSKYVRTTIGAASPNKEREVAKGFQRLLDMSYAIMTHNYSKDKESYHLKMLNTLKDMLEVANLDMKLNDDVVQIASLMGKQRNMYSKVPAIKQQSVVASKGVGLITAKEYIKLHEEKQAQIQKHARVLAEAVISQVIDTQLKAMILHPFALTNCKALSAKANTMSKDLLGHTDVPAWMVETEIKKLLESLGYCFQK